MNYEQYVRLLADLFSGDPEKVAKANAELYKALVGDDSRNPALALADAESLM